MPADPAAASDNSETGNSPNFEEGLEQLDLLVRTMESGELGLTESIAAYERGVGLLRRLHAELNAIELRVTTLVRLDADGNPVFEPAAAATDAEPAALGGDSAPRPGGRRKRPAATRNRARLPGMDEPGETP